jgi:hypothetical protein
VNGAGTYLQEFFRMGNPFLWLGVVWSAYFFIWAPWIYVAKFDPLAARAHWARVLYMRMLPGYGAVTGWIAVGYLWTVDWTDPQWEHLVIGAVAFLGITGNIPPVIMLSTFLRQSTAPTQTPTGPPGRTP